MESGKRLGGRWNLSGRRRLSRTIAYKCIVNLLGVKLLSASAVTADVDIAGKTVPVAVIPEVVCPQRS